MRRNAASNLEYKFSTDQIRITAIDHAKFAIKEPCQMIVLTDKHHITHPDWKITAVFMLANFQIDLVGSLVGVGNDDLFAWCIFIHIKESTRRDIVDILRVLRYFKIVKKATIYAFSDAFCRR